MRIELKVIGVFLLVFAASVMAYDCVVDQPKELYPVSSVDKFIHTACMDRESSLLVAF